MTPLKKTRIKTVMKYTWPFYIASAVIIVVVMHIIFAVSHQTPEYKTLTLFISGEVSESKKLKDDLLETYKDKELKSVSIISSDPNDRNYNSKLTIPGYNSADLLIIPSSKLEKLIVSDFALELSDELITSYYSGYNFYTKEEVKYGIKLNKEIVKKYMSLPSEDCYMFLNGRSSNLGAYSNKANAEHDNALTLAKTWGN